MGWNVCHGRWWQHRQWCSANVRSSGREFSRRAVGPCVEKFRYLSEASAAFHNYTATQLVSSAPTDILKITASCVVFFFLKICSILP